MVRHLFSDGCDQFIDPQPAFLGNAQIGDHFLDFGFVVIVDLVIFKNQRNGGKGIHQVVEEAAGQAAEFGKAVHLHHFFYLCLLQFFRPFPDVDFQQIPFVFQFGLGIFGPQQGFFDFSV